MAGVFISGIPTWRSASRDARRRLDRIAKPGRDPLFEPEVGKGDGDAFRGPDREAGILREAVAHELHGAAEWNPERRVQEPNDLDRENALVADAALNALPGPGASGQVMVRQEVVQPLDTDIKRKCNHANVI